MSFVTPQPSQSEIEFSRLKLETKAPRPLKLRISHAPPINKTNKQKRKKQKYTVANVQNKRMKEEKSETVHQHIMKKNC